MTLATARVDLGAALAGWLGEGYSVFPDVQPIDDVTKPTLLLVRTRVEKLPSAPMGAWLNTLALYVIVPQHAGEDALDQALEDVLEALDEAAETKWDSAERETWNDTNPAYAITLTTHSTRTDN
jgi:hypothetical protein